MTVMTKFCAQVDELRRAAELRSQLIQKVVGIEGAWQGRVLDMIRSHAKIAPILESLKTKAPFSNKNREQCLRLFYVVMQLFSDLRALEKLGELREKTRCFHQEATTLDSKVVQITDKIRERHDKIALLRAAVDQRQAENARLRALNAVASQATEPVSQTY